MKKISTIQIYQDDLKFLTGITKKNENFRDKLHEIIEEYKNKVRRK